MTCWASSLGGCDGKLSREHLVSEAFWPGESITAVGFPWCKTEPKRVGAAAIVSKVLCRTHNSLLSPVDAGGAHAFHALEASELLLQRRRHIAPQDWMRVGFAADGPLLERWFTKTAVNMLLVTGDEIRWALGGGSPSVPTQIVRAAFGIETLAHPLGLYLAAAIGESVLVIDGLSFMPIFEAHDHFAAALFDFRGFRFVLNLIDSPLPAVLPEMPGAAARWGGSRPNYRLNRINCNIGNTRSHFVDFSWPGSQFDHFAA